MKKKTRSAKAITAVMTAALVMAAAIPAFAAEDVDQPVSVIPAPGETVSETVGNITVDGSAEGSSSFAAYVVAPDGSQAELNVDGNITTAGNKVSEDEYTGTPYGAAAEAFNGTAALNVSGDVQVSGDDISVFSIGVMTIAADSTASVTIDGDLSVSSGSGIGIEMEGGGADETKTSKSSVEIGGDFTVENEGVAIGVQAMAGGGCAQEVKVDGDVTVTSEKYDGIAFIAGGMDSTTSIQVGGDVTSSTIGLQAIAGQDDTVPAIDVLIEGTLSAKEAPVLLVGEGNTPNVTLTAWKIVPGEDGKIVHGTDEMAEAAAELEKNILYIIKVEQPTAGGTLALSGTTDSHGFAAAKEGETVTLKLNLQNGYKLKGAYNGTTALTLIDKDGNYYIVVPKGGGVDLSVILEQIQSGIIPVAPAAPAVEEPAKEKELIEEYEFTTADSEAAIAFYNDSTVVITLPDGTKAEGTFVFVDGKLTFNGIELEVTIDEDGSYHCIYVTASGETIEFVLDAEFVEKLLGASQG